MHWNFVIDVPLLEIQLHVMPLWRNLKVFCVLTGYIHLLEGGGSKLEQRLNTYMMRN